MWIATGAQKVSYTYSYNENGGQVTTGFLHRACCFLKYEVIILSSVIVSAGSATAGPSDSVVFLLLPAVAELNARISCRDRDCLADDWNGISCSITHYTRT